MTCYQKGRAASKVLIKNGAGLSGKCLRGIINNHDTVVFEKANKAGVSGTGAFPVRGLGARKRFKGNIEVQHRSFKL